MTELCFLDTVNMAAMASYEMPKQKTLPLYQGCRSIQSMTSTESSLSFTWQGDVHWPNEAPVPLTSMETMAKPLEIMAFLNAKLIGSMGKVSSGLSIFRSLHWR